MVLQNTNLNRVKTKIGWLKNNSNATINFKFGVFDKLKPFFERLQSVCIITFHWYKGVNMKQNKLEKLTFHKLQESGIESIT